MEDDTTTSTLDILDTLNAVKILAQNDSVATVGGYGIVFGGRDLEGETFTKTTDYMIDLVPRKLVFYDHAQQLNHKIGTVSNDDIIVDDTGLWIQAQLDKSAQYVDGVLKLIDEGVIGWSSGSVAHLARRDNGVIKTWPIVEFSLTPTPAEPRTLGVDRIKAMAESDPSLKALIPEMAQESHDGGATAKVATADVSILDEEKTMTEMQDVPTLTAEAIGNEVGAQFKSVIEPLMQRIDSLEKALPKDDGGVKVLGDEADRELDGRPFKGIGEFLQSVANGNDQRLRPLRSDVTGLNGYYDVTKAVSSDYIGHFGPAVKAPLGLQEGIPSAGGFLVGQDRNAGLLSRMYEAGGLLRRADTVGISANSNGMTFNAEDETSRVTGSRRGGIQAYWAAEAEEKTKSKPKFRQMELKLKKIIALAYATDELLEDAAALESWIMQNLPEEMAVLAEIAMFRGTGVGQMLGILNSGALVSVAKETGQAAATIESANIDKMWSRRWVRGSNYIWLVNQDTGPQLAQLNRAVGTGGDIVYSPPGGISAAPYASLKGAPVLEIEYASTLGTVGDIMLVDLSQYQMIDKGGIKSDSSIHVQFLTDQTVFRFVYRLDGQPKWSEPLTPMNGTNDVSPFVALATRA